MKAYLDIDPWRIIESGLHKKDQKVSESVFSIGNGNFGQRGNFEESYSGETLSGNYVAGIYYPDKTRVGWWKNGYPEYFAKVLNACNWIDLKLSLGDEVLDLNHVKSLDQFRRCLDMKTGILSRTFEVTLHNDAKVTVESERFCSMADNELAAMRYNVSVQNFNGPISFQTQLDNDVLNEDSNYDEQFWLASQVHTDKEFLFVQAKTKKTNFHVATASKDQLKINEQMVSLEDKQNLLSVGHHHTLNCEGTAQLEFSRTVCIVSDLNHAKAEQFDYCMDKLRKAKAYQELKNDHADYWKNKWEEMDITIEGDDSAQQGIRFNIFQLYQTYTGHDHRLNIGPKGFTGEKYGGSTYWDTEAYCIPFYLGTSDRNIARNLLIYRHFHLAKAIENAQKLGLKNGAALYPMVTMNGEECHNEWEITFEEIHRNGAIAYAIFDYIRYTNDQQYLLEYGLEVLIGIARFWAERVNYSKDKNAFVILGVTGPNEYENNVNNNWYTNYIAQWCLKYCSESIHWAKAKSEKRAQEILSKLSFDENKELTSWKEIVENIYLPEDKERDIFLQQDGFLDKDIIQVGNLPEEDRPLNQKWSWDKILRSCFIKQADVLQGLYFFEDQFTEKQLRNNFEFYEPLTVHESSLSPCIHSILASRLNLKDKAYEMYLRTSRLDLDDYNNDTEDGCHITSMAGTWMSIVKGFVGQRIKDNKLWIAPNIPDAWKSIKFKLNWQQRKIDLNITSSEISLNLIEGEDMDCYIYNSLISLSGNAQVTVKNELLHKT